MSSKLLPLIIQTTVPTGSENLAAGYHIGQSWLNTVTGLLYIHNTNGVWNNVSLAPHASSHYAGGSDQIDGQLLYGLRTSDSPTFAGLTATGASVFGSTVTQNASRGSLFYRLQASGVTQGLLTTPGTIAGTSAPGLVLFSETGMPVQIATNGSATPVIDVSAGGVTTIYGTATGTAGAGEVRIGDGQINAAGGGAFGASCAINSYVADEVLQLKSTTSPYLGFYPSGGGTRKSYIQCGSGGSLAIVNEGTGGATYIYGQDSAASALFDNSSTSGDTRLLLWDVAAGAIVRVTRGAADSGGTGYRVLRIPN